MSVTNLTNTTWYIPSGWSASAGHGQFIVDWMLTDNNGNLYSYTEFDIGYKLDRGLGAVVGASNYIYVGAGYSFGNSVSFIATFTGGNDVTNPSLISWLETYGTQLNVDNLTDTTWTVASGWEAEAGYGQFNVNGTFTSDNYINPTEFIGLWVGSLKGGSASSNYVTFVDPMSDSIGTSVNKNLGNTKSLTINITGGTDTTNPKLIAWLSKYGELQEERITDLTGYTVTVPSGWSATADYGSYYLNFSILSSTSSLGWWDNNTILYIGSFDESPERNAISSNELFVAYPESTVTIKITGGTDTSKPELIQWFYDNNATFTKTEEPETPEQPTTPTKKFTRLYIGEIVKTIGNKVFRKLQITAPIKFTIGGTEYQAEPSMTFGEWLESGYNTSDYYTKTITSDGVEYNPIIIAEDGDAFTVAEAKGAVIEIDTPITADFGYTTVTLTQDSALQAGLYDANDNLVASWDELVNTYGMNPTISYSSSSSSSTYYKTCKTSPYYVLTKNSKLSSGVKLVIGNIGTSIPSRLFFECEQLTDIIVPEGVKTLSSYCFGQCAGLKNITLPNTITSISTYVFYYCDNLLELTIPDGVTKLSNQMCIYCESLKSVVIPSTVTSIGVQTFSWCYDLGDITFKGTVSQWNSITFDTSWKQSVPATQVVCSDGTVTL